MDEFQVTAKLWPSGDSLDLGIDANTVTVPSTFTRHAANFVTSMDGEHNYQFLFWNTGRHVTNKRHVRWNFSVGGWGLWTATRWYGTPGTGGIGPARVRADGFSLADNGPLGPETPIDGGSSTFAAGAWPFNSEDNEIGTAGGPVVVRAKDPFHQKQFAGWARLIWGGDDSGEFVETDTGASMGTNTFFEHSTGPYNVAQGGSVDLLATYGNSDKPDIGKFDWGKLFKDRGIDFPIDTGDPGPEDLIRLVLIEQLLRQTQPAGGGSAGGQDYQQLIQNAARMTPEELRRARTQVQTSLDLGRTALGALETQIKQRGGG